MKIKTAELSERQLNQIFSEWFEKEWRRQLNEVGTPTTRQRQYMRMAWFGWHARSLLGDEVDIPDELMESQQ